MAVKKYFPNDWRKWKSVPAEFFEPIPMDEFMEWRATQWELPSSVSALIRAQSHKTGKIKEYVYQQSKSAEKRVLALMDDEDNLWDITMVTHDQVHQFTPKELTNDEDE